MWYIITGILVVLSIVFTIMYLCNLNRYKLTVLLKWSNWSVITLSGAIISITVQVIYSVFKPDKPDLAIAILFALVLMLLAKVCFAGMMLKDKIEQDEKIEEKHGKLF